MTEQKRTALVTGGTGFVGSHVVDALLEAGYKVRCTVRRTSRLRWLEGKAVELVETDLAGADLSRIVTGVDSVFHFAGLTRGTRRQLYAANYEATRALVAACAAQAKEPRFVFCSSQAAAGPSELGELLREEDTPRPTSDYGRSKLEAEGVVLQESRIRAIVLRPGAVYGPRDEDTLPYFQMAARGLIVIPGLRSRYLQMVHAGDVARAARAAAEVPDAAGKIFYVVHPEVLTWSGLSASIAEAVGRRVIRLRVPSLVLRGIGTLATALGGGSRPGQLDRRRARDLSERAWTCDPGKAERVLGWSPDYNAERGLKETADWYRRQGWV